jgi:ABC-type branched-subunit amino acid transport system ATPase component
LLAATLAHLRGVSYWHWLSGDPIARRARRDSRHLAEEVAVAAGLVNAVHEPCSALTSGQSRIVDVLLALASRSRIVLLDEPAAGLSEAERRRLGATIRALTDHGLGVLVVEHDLELALSIADRVTVLGQGAVLASGVPEHIKEHAAVREVLLGSAT